MKIARLVFWPGVVAALLGLPLALALLERVPNINDFEIIHPAPQRQSTFVGLGHTSDDQGVHTARKLLWPWAQESLLAHDEVRLLFVTYGTQPSLVRGEIREQGTGCTYQTLPGAVLANADYLTFTRGAPCAPSDGTARPLELSLVFSGDGRVGLATYFVPPTSGEPGWLALTPPDPADPRPVAIVRGRYVDVIGAPSMRRIDLLAYVWNVAASPWWIWAVVTSALIALMAGVSGATSSSHLRRAVGAGCLGLALGMLYAVLVPPLQAPDEPDHMLAFVQVANRPHQADSLAALARRGHFERIHFRPAERFRPVDVERPSAVHWDNLETFAHNVAGRSLTTWAWWKSWSPLLGHERAATALLTLRLANAVVFALAMGVATALLLLLSPASLAAPHTVMLALLLIPTLPFFATHVSEFALLTSTYVVLAAIIAALFLDGERSHWLGLPLGLATTAILAGGRSGLPFVATLAAAMTARALLGTRGCADTVDRNKPAADNRRDLRRSAIFWIGLGAGLAVFGAVATQEFRDGLWPGDTGRVPDWFRAVAELVRSHPWLIAVIAPLGFGLERAAARFRRAVPAPGTWDRRLVRAICVIAGLGIAASSALSMVLAYPLLGPMESARPDSAQTYAIAVAKVAATGFRLGNHDWLLSTSFWAGFGWLDTIPDSGLVTILVGLTAAAVLILLIHLGLNGDRRRLTFLGILGAGWSLTVVVYAISSYYLNRNLHGRYLVGLYLSVLAICACGVALSPQGKAFAGWRGSVREWSIVAGVVALHAYTLRFVLSRYF